MDPRGCASLHRFCPATEYDADSAAIDEAVAALRAAAHRAQQTKRKTSANASIQCNLQPEPQPEPEPEREATPSVVTPPAEEEPPRTAEPQPPSVVKGELNINGNVLLATDWDLVDDDVRFAHYPLLDLDCCGVRQQRQAHWRKQQQQQRSISRPMRRIQRDELQEELRLQRLQRIPKYREAFPVRPQAVNPEATDEVRNRVRQTYDHAHSLPLHEDDSYLKLHMKARRSSAKRLPTPGRFGHRRSSSAIAGRPLSVEVPVCACPRVVPANNDCHCCQHSSPPQQLWGVQTPQPPQAVPNVVFTQGAPPVALKGPPPPLAASYGEYPSVYTPYYPPYHEQGGYVTYPSMSYSMEAPIGFPLPPIKTGKI